MSAGICGKRLGFEDIFGSPSSPSSKRSHRSRYESPTGVDLTFGSDDKLQLLLRMSMDREEAPAVIKSVFDKRIVGCPGDEGEDEHDVVWFWLEKDKPHECPVCSQYFVLEVVGPGGPPDGHGEDHH